MLLCNFPYFEFFHSREIKTQAGFFHVWHLLIKRYLEIKTEVHGWNKELDTNNLLESILTHEKWGKNSPQALLEKCAMPYQS